MEGVLKGYDQLLNLVLDETIEYARGTLPFGCRMMANQPPLLFRSGSELLLFVIMELPFAILWAAVRPLLIEKVDAAADKDDMLKTTDDTRPMGLVVRHPASS